jgi:hypothetical protein
MSENTNETVALENMTSQERDSWRMTGVEPVREDVAEIVEPKSAKVAEKEEIKSEPAPKEDAEVTASGEEDGESGTPTKTEEQRAKKPGQMGYKELRNKIAELQAQIDAGKKPAAADNEAAKADAKSDEKPRPKSTDKKADGSPKYQTWEEYEDDLLGWREEKLRATVKGESEKAQQEAQKAKLQEELNTTVKQRADEARKKYTDFDEKVFAKDLVVPKDSVLYNWIMDAENERGMDIAYHYATNRDDLTKFNALSPFQQARELTRLEDKLSKTTETSDAKASDVKVVAPPKVTKAPPPAREVGGRGASSGDEETATVNSGDFRAYSKVVNAKETSHLKAARK